MRCWSLCWSVSAWNTTKGKAASKVCRLVKVMQGVTFMQEVNEDFPEILTNFHCFYWIIYNAKVWLMLQEDTSRWFLGLLHLPSPGIPQTPFSQPLLHILQGSPLHLPLPVVGELHFVMAMAMAVLTSMAHTYRKTSLCYCAESIILSLYTCKEQSPVQEKQGGNKKKQEQRAQGLYAVFQRLVITHNKANLSTTVLSPPSPHSRSTYVNLLCQRRE